MLTALVRYEAWAMVEFSADDDHAAALQAGGDFADDDERQIKRELKRGNAAQDVDLLSVEVQA